MMCGHPEGLAEALRIVEQDRLARRLHLNRNNSLVYYPNSADLSSSPLPTDIPTTCSSFTLLGCPIGPSTFCKDVLSHRLGKVKEALAKLPDFEDSQMETTLLRSCLPLPKVAFSLRTCPPAKIKQAMREALSDLTGTPLSEWSWQKATLPSSRGGLNLREATLHAPAAFLSSSSQSLPLVTWILGDAAPASRDLGECISALADAAGRPDWYSFEDIDVPIYQ